MIAALAIFVFTVTLFLTSPNFLSKQINIAIEKLLETY